MKTSIDCMLTTHVGSLPRPKSLLALLGAQDKSEPFDPAAFDAQARIAIGEAVAAQIGVGARLASEQLWA